MFYYDFSEATQKTLPKSTESEVEDGIKRWLVKAKDRRLRATGKSTNTEENA